MNAVDMTALQRANESILGEATEVPELVDTAIKLLLTARDLLEVHGWNGDRVARFLRAVAEYQT